MKAHADKDVKLGEHSSLDDRSSNLYSSKGYNYVSSPGIWELIYINI